MLTEKLLKLTIVGGSEWVMWLLIALSAISLTIIVERFFFFLSKRSDLDALDGRLSQVLGRGEDALEKVRTAVNHYRQPALMAAAAARPGDNLEAVEKHVAAVLGRERLRLEQRLGFLGTLGSNAPFIGLFGTVLGIIRAFNDLSLDSKGGSSAVMAGISEALVATAIGLFVAIPAVMAYNYFQKQLDHVSSTTESLAQSILAEQLRVPDVSLDEPSASPGSGAGAEDDDADGDADTDDEPEGAA